MQSDRAPSLLRLVRDHPHGVLAAALLSVVVGVLGWATAFLVQFVLDRTGERRLLVLVAIGVAAAAAARAVVTVARRIVQMSVVRAIEGDLARRYLRHLMRLEMREWDRFPAGDFVQRLRGLEHVRNALEDRLLGATFDAVLVLVAAAILLSYSPPLGCLAILGALLPAVVVRCVRDSIGRSFEESQCRDARLTHSCMDVLHAMRDLRLLDGEEELLGRLEGNYGDFQRGRIRHLAKLAVIGSGTAILSTFTSILILLLGARSVASGDLSTGRLMFVFTMAGVMLGPLENLTVSWIFFDNAAVALDRSAEILRLPAEPRGATAVPAPLRGEIRLESVTFGYQLDRPVLRDVTLDISAGSSLAVVGESGAGKSTLLALLAGLYTPDQGRILIDGADTRTLPVGEWRHRVGAVFQSPHLFDGTVEENIRLGRAGATADEIRRAARLAGADDFILALPQGYATPLHGDGGNLSGGQVQRIAIARALVRNPTILLLDEATNNLDGKAEEAIWSLLAAGLRTTIFVTHRLATARHADRIAVLHDGRVVEEGPFSEVVHRRGRFRELWERQNCTSSVPNVH